MIQKPKIIITHPTGNANVRSAVNGLADLNILHKFNTTVAIFPSELLFKLGAFPLFEEMRRRSYNPDVKKFTYRYPFYELGRLLADKIGLNKLVRHESGFFCIEKVYQMLDNKTASNIHNAKQTEAIGVYSYEDGAAFTFREARKEGIHCFYDLPIGYWRTKMKLLSSEKQRRPEWAATIPSLNDSDFKLTRKDKELQLADRIFVASSFTKKTLKDYPTSLAPIHVIPYGFPKVVPNRTYNSLKNRRLKIIYVGSLTQRKGIADLFEAVNNIGSKIELTVVGKKVVEDCAILNENLSKHKWIPTLPHDEILDLMRNQDILLFPSLFEGFGLVISEAMSQGTPVITTNRTAGPDLITHGKDGWIVDAASSEAIENQLEAILQQPSRLELVGRAAMDTAKKRPWEMYGRELAQAIIDHS